MSRRAKADPARIEELDVVYAELPTIACKGLCQDSCGPIVQARTPAKQELLRMQDAGGEKRGRQQRQPLTCPYLTAEDETGQCSVYEARPLICRLWGVVEEMRCPHGCEATAILTDREAKAAMAFVETIGGRMAQDPAYTRLAQMMSGTDLEGTQRIVIGKAED